MKKLLTILILLIGCTTTKPHTETRYNPVYIQQEDDYSCGAVALYNALQFRGTPESLDYLKEITNTQPSTNYVLGGTTMNNLLIAAYRLGFNLRLIDKKDIKYNGTYIIRILAPVNQDVNNMYGHFVFMAKGKVYNLDRKVETPVTSTFILAVLYDEPNNKSMVFEVL